MNLVDFYVDCRRWLRRTLSRTLIAAIGGGLIAVQLLAFLVGVATEYSRVSDAAEQRANAAIDMLASVHSEAMLNRRATADNDAAVATLNGTMVRFASLNQDVHIWLVMAPKIIAFQKAQGSAELERPRDAVDREVLRSARPISRRVGGDVLRVSRPIIMGQGVASNEKCASCHGVNMGIARGETMGAYSASVDMSAALAAWRGDIARQALWNFLLLGVLVAGVWLLLRHLALMRLEQLTEIASRFRGGQRDIVVPDDPREDEIAKLGREIHSVWSELAEREKLEKRIRTEELAARERERIALEQAAALEARRSRELERAAELETARALFLEQTLSRFVGSISQFALRLQRHSKCLIGNAAAISERMSKSARDAEIAGAYSRESQGIALRVSATMQSLADNFEAMSAEILDASQSAARASGTSIDGRLVVEDLGSSTKRVATLIEAVDSVAQQTSLLALNATIEAARAGEHGRGFAVVAQEVSQLARETRETSALAARIVSEVRQSVDDAAEKFAAIDREVGDVALKNGKMRLAAEEKRLASADMLVLVNEANGKSAMAGEAVGSVVNDVRETSLMGEALRSVSEDLDCLAHDLEAEVGLLANLLSQSLRPDSATAA